VVALRSKRGRDCSESPKRLKRSTAKVSAAPGKIDIHHASSEYALASNRIEPH
jgi:hypothetical protein